MGRPLPAGVIAMYQAHDGTHDEESAILAAMRAPNDAQWARYMWWLSAEDARKKLAFMRGLGNFAEELMPFALDAGGNLLVVDTRTGRVAAWDHETAETTTLANDMDAWVSALADDMENKLVAAPNDDPDEEDFDDGRLMLLDAPPPPPPAAGAPVLAEDRAARVLVEVLQERKFVEMTKRANLEPLVKELHEALAHPIRGERRARVITILEESDVVDEIFADDEKIGGIVDALM